MAEVLMRCKVCAGDVHAGELPTCQHCGEVYGPDGTRLGYKDESVTPSVPPPVLPSGMDPEPIQRVRVARDLSNISQELKLGVKDEIFADRIAGLVMERLEERIQALLESVWDLVKFPAAAGAPAIEGAIIPPVAATSAPVDPAAAYSDLLGPKSPQPGKAHEPPEV